jgi:hypothetical protein
MADEEVTESYQIQENEFRKKIKIMNCGLNLGKIISGFV